MDKKRRAIEVAKKDKADLIFWHDGSKLNQEGTEVAIV